MSGTSLLVASTLITVVPLAIYVTILWLVDRHEKEPLSMLAAAVLGGAVVAPVLTISVERALGIPNSVFPALFQLYPVVQPNLAGAVIEELAKALVVLAAYVALRREFDGTLDGIVYGAAVGAGFALAESVSYLRDLAPLAAQATFGASFFFAIFVSGLTHCVFSALFGASLGYVRETAPPRGARLWIPLVGLAAAALYHLGYVAFGSSALTGSMAGGSALFGVARRLADYAGIVLLGLIVVWAWSRERNVLRWALADEAATGAVSAEDLAGLRGRGRELRRIREAQAELAFAKWRLSRGIGSAEDVVRQRERVIALRSAEQVEQR